MAVTTGLMLVASLLAACCLHLVVADKTHSTAGTDFYVAFMGLNNEAKLNRYRAQVFLTNPNQADVKVHTDYLGFQEDSEVSMITAHSTRTISLPLAVVLSTSGVHRGCARITSTLDIYVQASLECLDSSRASMAGYPILPTASLGADYIVATHCSSGQCVFLVTATEKDTDVTISLRVSKSCAEYSDSDYCNEDQIVERLHQGESLLVTCGECDMTGTGISASGKVSVVAGGDYTQFEKGSANADAVAEQMLPLEWLSTRYVLGTGLQNMSTITKVVVLWQGQAFLHNGVQQKAATTDRQVYVFTSGPSSSEVTIIQSESPLLVVRVIGASGDRPATSMYVAVAAAQWSDAYRVYLPLGGRQSKAYICLVMPPEANYTVDGANSDSPPAQPELTENVVSMNLTSTDERVDIAVRMIQVERACLFTISSNHPFTGYVIYDDGYYGSSVLPLLWGVSPEQETSVLGNQKETLPPAAQKISPDTSQRATRIPGASTPNTRPFASVGTQRVTETTDSSPAAASTREVHLGTGAHAQQKPPETGGTAAQHSAASAAPELNLVTEERSSGAAGTTQEVSGTRRGKSPRASAALPEANDNTAPTPEAPGTSLPSERQGATAGTTAVTASANNDPVTKTTLAYSPNWDKTSIKTAATVSPNVVTGRQQREEGKPTGIKPACCRCVRKAEPAARANEAASEGDNRGEGPQRLTKELLSDRKSLSSYGRTRGCRRDARKSSAVIGTAVGIVAFVTGFSFIVIPDVVCLCRHVAAAAAAAKGPRVCRQRRRQ